MQDAAPQSSDARSFAATMLRSGARAIASHAAESLLESYPEAGQLFGPKAYRGWHDNLSQRVDELAASVELGSAELFASDVAWSVAAFAAREVPTETVGRSLEALRAAITSDLPPMCVKAVDPVLEAGIRATAGEPMSLDRLVPGSPRADLTLRFLETTLDGNRRDAIRLVLDAYAEGAPVGDLYEQVLLPAERELGTMWHLGEISVPEEHAATEAIRGAMAVLSHTAGRESASQNASKVLVGAIEGDRHDIGVRAVADLVEIAGHTSVYLGADVPVRDLVRACECYTPSAVVLSAMMTVHLPALTQAIRAVREADVPRVIVGGGAFKADPALAQRVDADGYAHAAADVVRLLA